MTEQSGPNPRGSSQPTPRAGTGLDPNISGALCYLLTWITGIIFLLVEKDNDYVRFHAVQAIAFGIAVFVLGIALSVFSTVVRFIPFIGGILASLVWFAFSIGFLILWIVLMIKAYQGQRYNIPILGDMIKNWTNR